MLQAILSLLFPPQCAVCDDVGSGLCERCFPSTAEPLRFRTASLDVVALGAYEGALKRAVLALKDGRRDVATALGERLRPHLWHVPAIVPVPTTMVRRLERGFDGCALLAGAANEMAMADGLVQTAGDAQRGRSRTQRLAATGRFRWRGEPVHGRRIVLLDDVVTTGSTLEDCAATLRACGAIVESAVVVARALPVPERIATSEPPRPSLSIASL